MTEPDKEQKPKKGKVPDKVIDKIASVKVKSLLDVVGTAAQRGNEAREFARFINYLTCQLAFASRRADIRINADSSKKAPPSTQIQFYTPYKAAQGLIRSFIRFDHLMEFSSPKWLKEADARDLTVFLTVKYAPGNSSNRITTARVQVVIKEKSTGKALDFFIPELSEGYAFLYTARNWASTILHGTTLCLVFNVRE